MAGKIKIVCKKCGRFCNSSQIKRHEESCSGVYIEKKKTIFTGRCSFCGKECKNSNVQRNHERLCKLNPDYVANSKFLIERNQAVGYIPWQHKIENREKYEAWLKTIAEVNRNPEKLQKSKVTYIKNKPFRKKFHQTNEAKSKLSEIRSKAIEEMGQGGFLDVKYYSICNILGEEFKVRGTWELKYADFLNKNNILWIRKLYIKYTTPDGVIRTYTPDFYLPSKNEYIEVKGYFSDEDKNKIKYVTEQNNITIEILMCQDLINLGIDLKNTDVISPTKKSKPKIERKQGLSSDAIDLRTNAIKNSSVDFNKKGWPKELSDKLLLHPTYIKRFMKKHMNEFYLACRKY